MIADCDGAANERFRERRGWVESYAPLLHDAVCWKFGGWKVDKDGKDLPVKAVDGRCNLCGRTGRVCG